MLSDEEIDEVSSEFKSFVSVGPDSDSREVIHYYHAEEFARAIESAATAPLLARIAEQDALIGKLRLEAQIQAQEARTANATVAEIYQLCSGGTGEPGNWNGAAPVKARIAELTRELEESRKDAERYRFIRDADRSDCITQELSLYAMETLDEYVDAAMEGEAELAIRAAIKEQP